MDAWDEDQLHALLSIKCESTLFKTIVSAAQSLGFEYCAYGLRTPLPITRPRTLVFNNYAADWQQVYQEKNYLEVDPTVQHGMRSLLPVIWSDDASGKAAEFWEDARSFGLQYGWAQSTFSAGGLRGMLSLARSGEPLSKSELESKAPKMVWLTQMAHHGMSNCLASKLSQDVEQPLSGREIEVLRWAAEGKTSSEISEILSITERTANFHIANAMTKLNAPNKTAAVVRAVMLGLLYTS